jgi:hypothetical protein
MGRATVLSAFSEKRAGVRRFFALYLLTFFFQTPSSITQNLNLGALSLSLNAAGNQHIGTIRTTP